MKSKPLLLFITTIFILAACSQAPVVRRSSGYSTYNKTSARPGVQDGYAPLKKKIVLLSFFNEAPYGKEDLAVTVTEELRREILQAPNYVLDNQMEADFGNSKEIYSGGGLKLAQVTRKAKMAGINLIVFGRIINARVRQQSDEIGLVRKMKSYAESEVEVKIFDIYANKEIFSEKLSGNINDSAYKFFMSERDTNLEYRRDLLRYSVKVAVRRAIPKLIALGDKLDWTGRVAKIIGSKIYLNAGRQSGLNVGDVLRVMTEGSEVYDPETGALLGMSKGQVKGTLEIIDYFGNDGSVAILHSGGSVTEGDFVQLY